MDFQDLVTSNTRMEFLKRCIQQMQSKLIKIKEKSVTRDTPLGYLKLFEDYKYMSPLETRSMLNDLLREYELYVKSSNESRLLSYCHKEEAVPPYLRIKIWPGLSQPPDTFCKEWELEVHAISLRLMQLAAEGHRRAADAYREKIKETYARILGMKAITLEEKELLEKFFQEWKQMVADEGGVEARISKIIEGYGTTYEQHKIARGKQPLTNQYPKNHERFYADAKKDKTNKDDRAGEIAFRQSLDRILKV